MDEQAQYDMLVRIAERVEYIQRMLESADIPRRCAAEEADMRFLKWAFGLVCGALVGLFGYVLHIRG